MDIERAPRHAPHLFQGDHPHDACRVCGDPQAPATAMSYEGLHLPALPSPLCPDHGYAVSGGDGRCLGCEGAL